MTNLHREAAAMAHLAQQQANNAADYDRMAEAYPHRAELYRAQAARCRLDAAWYGQKARERREWAEGEPITAEEMLASLTGLMRKDEAA